MCCCGKPVINGQPGYRSQPSDAPSIRPVDPPSLEPSDELLYDEPGRCGGLDAHSHHFRLVRRYSSLVLLVRHGGGDESFRLLHTNRLTSTLASLDTHSRYWLFHTIYSAYDDGKRVGAEKENSRWRQAAAEKRIKTRKQRGSSAIKVWIDSK